MTKKQVWQNHHITYQPERVVRVTRGEHWVVTQLQRFKSLSRGAKEALLYEINRLPARKDNSK